MAYARIAARHFATEHHEHYLTPDELVRSIPDVAARYDQPFGNSSVLPTYCCARMARSSGVTKLLAGDGGDELFGGNTRYAKQKIFAAYAAVPGPLRRGVVEPLLLGVPGVERLPLVRKLASYVRQARTPMPERMEAYNLLARLGVAEVLEPGFLASVDTEAPARAQRDTYAACAGTSLVDRMLEYDWKYTLADNDLPKVCGAAALAGVRVGFPFLADEIVDFSVGLPASFKVKGLRLRYFFKEALRGFLPDATLAKEKHGFGLPFGVWLTRHEGLRSFAGASLARLATRGIVRPSFLEALVARKLAEHPAFYGEMVWILMMLEQWFAARTRAAPAAGVPPIATTA
jgi:asparagine synthase (glutamine-hydrolysing)